MTSKFKEIIDLCSKIGFIKFIESSSSKSCEKMSLGPVGCLLQENLKSEWMNTNLTNRDISVFLDMDENLTETYNFAKEFCQERLPFGIAQIVGDSSVWKSDNEANEVDFYFRAANQVKLQTLMFVPPNNSAQYFYNWQKQRRMWWRKISASPGRYSLTDIQISPSGEQSVDILSTYPWGSHIMENIFLNTNGEPSLTNEQLQTKDGRKKVTAHCITSTTYLSTMVLNTLCDAYDEPLFQEVKRPLLRFHRKIAPYKISFAITSAGSSEDLNDLALYLCKKLRNNLISVLLIPSASRNTLETQWIKYDELGIPYCVVLNDNTLKNGIAHLRSRDTTLKEQVHVSDLPEYVEKLFKYY